MRFSHLLMAGAVAPLALVACSGERVGDVPAPPPGEVGTPAEPEVLPEEPEAVEPARAEAGGRWTARGNEPGWTLTLDETKLTYVYGYGEGRYEADRPAAETVDGGRRYTTADGAVSVTVLDKVCADDMTGMPYPQTVTVQMEDARVNGCGGQTNALLAGAWEVTAINGAAVTPAGVVTLTFEPQAETGPANPEHFVPSKGRVSGKAACNSYGADYTISGEGISFGSAFATEMACEADLMSQESAFLSALRGVGSISVNEAGLLELTDHQDAKIEARRN